MASWDQVRLGMTESNFLEVTLVLRALLQVGSQSAVAKCLHDREPVDCCCLTFWWEHWAVEGVEVLAAVELHRLSTFHYLSSDAQAPCRLVRVAALRYVP